MTTVNDIIEVVDEQTFDGQPIANVYHYQVLAIGSGLVENALLNMFIGALWPDITAVQSDEVTHNGLRWKNLDDIAEDGFIAPPSAITGVEGGDYATSLLTWNFRMVRTTRLTRNGRKAIGGVPEALMFDNNPTPAAAGQLVTLGVELGRIQNVSGWSFQPVIFGRPTATQARRINPVASAFYTHIGTQKSRKTY